MSTKKAGPVPGALKKSNVPINSTPIWLTPEDKAKLRARVLKIRQKNQKERMKKENVSLVKAEGSSLEPSPSHKDDPPPPDRTKSSSPLAVDKSNARTKSKESIASAMKSKSRESVYSSGEPRKHKSNDSVNSKHKPKKSKSKDSVGSKNKKEKKGKNRDDEQQELTMAKKKHPKEPHANPTGNVVVSQVERKLEMNNLDSHLYASDVSNFNPQLYHFKSPEKLSTKNPIVAECPPFWVLLDHTVAVTWKLFAPEADRGDLGIVPLQWSREFVSAMRDERGEYLFAVGHLLSTIEDVLLDRYSKAANLDDGGTTSNEEGKTDKEKDSMSYVSSESIFQHPFEVSYSLRDIMSRNMPGRQRPVKPEVEVAAKGKKTQAVKKLDVSIAPPPPGMKRDEFLNYLKHLKEEQEARVEKEKDYVSKIGDLIEYVRKGYINTEEWLDALDKSKKPEHVHFTGDVDASGVHKPVKRISSLDEGSVASTESTVSSKGSVFSIGSLDSGDSIDTADAKQRTRKPPKSIKQNVNGTTGKKKSKSKTSKLSKKSLKPSEEAGEFKFPEPETSKSGSQESNPTVPDSTNPSLF